MHNLLEYIQPRTSDYNVTQPRMVVAGFPVIDHASCHPRCRHEQCAAPASYKNAAADAFYVWRKFFWRWVLGQSVWWTQRIRIRVCRIKFLGQPE
jgi:hypothetical protein